MSITITEEKITTRQELESQIEYIEQSNRDHSYSPAMSYVEDAETHVRNGGRAI